MEQKLPDVEKIAFHIQEVIKELVPVHNISEDKQHLLETPVRVARALMELTSGYWMNPKEVIQKQFKESSELVLIKNMDFVSMCSHHMLPFIGKAHVAYVPNKEGVVVGLSKIPRLIEVFAHRLQVQEKLTRQIADTIMKEVDADGVMVVLEAQHLCMMIRGAKCQNGLTVTSAVRGCFEEQTVRSETLHLINGGYSGNRN